MGTRLWNAKENSEGISGKGAGKLTAKVIKDLTQYYGVTSLHGKHEKPSMNYILPFQFIRLHFTTR